MIYYFSGTGNSAYVAKRISAITEEPTCSVNDKIKNGDFSAEKTGEKIIFVVPTYAWRIPKVVEHWIKTTDFKENPPVYFVMTCGGQVGNAEKYIKKLCAEKKFLYMGLAEIVMPENYIALFGTPDKEEAERVIQKAEPLITKTAESIRHGRRLTSKSTGLADRIYSGPVNKLFYPMFVHADKFRAEDNCIGCGKCKKECPLNNIEIVNGKPVWGKDCTHCMACISKCPVEAIEYGKNSKGKVRYQCPYK